MTYDATQPIAPHNMPPVAKEFEPVILAPPPPLGENLDALPVRPPPPPPVRQAWEPEIRQLFFT